MKDLGNDEIREYLSSFPKCVNYVFREIGLGEITTAQKYLAQDLEKAYKREEYLIIEQFRGLGKSLITSIFVLWILAKNRDLKVLVVSGTDTKAKNFVRFCFMVMSKTYLFKFLAPDRRGGARTSTQSFDVRGAKPAQDPSLRSLGITGTITSARANIIIADDIETKKNARTANQRQNLLEITTEFEALLTAGAKQFICYLGTRHHMDSIYHRIREERKYKHIITPVLFPRNKQEVEAYRGLLSPHIYQRLKDNPSLYGQPVDERFPLEEIEKKRLGMGKTAFEMQFMLRVPTDKERFPLSLDDVLITRFKINYGLVNMVVGNKRGGVLEIKGMRPEDNYNYYRNIGIDTKSDFTILSIDPSGRGADLFSYSVISTVSGRFFIHKVDGLEGGYSDENLTQIIRDCKKFKVRVVVIEDNFGDGIVGALLYKIMEKINYRVHIEGIKNTKNKIERIITTLEPLFNQHRIIFHERVIKDSNRIYEDIGIEHSLIYQISYLELGGELEHDDCLDSLEIGIKYLSDFISRGTAKHEISSLNREIIRQGKEKGANIGYRGVTFKR
jgi:hypothetical protein